MKGIKLSKEEAISRCIKYHGNKYDYSKVSFKRTCEKVVIICPIHGEFKQSLDNHMRGCGCSKCSHINKKRIYGVGVLDIFADRHKSLVAWRSMLQRCYDSKRFGIYPTYKDCTVCDEWLLFSNFKRWFDENYIEGYALDKDILVKGNKVYSPDTCCFVPHEINESFISTKKDGLPVGIHFYKGKYCAKICINKKQIYLGRFIKEEDALNAYLKHKRDYFIKMANTYFANGKINYKVYKAILSYGVE